MEDIIKFSKSQKINILKEIQKVLREDYTFITSEQIEVMERLQEKFKMFLELLNYDLPKRVSLNIEPIQRKEYSKTTNVSNRYLLNISSGVMLKKVFYWDNGSVTFNYEISMLYNKAIREFHIVWKNPRENIFIDDPFLMEYKEYKDFDKEEYYQNLIQRYFNENSIAIFSLEMKKLQRYNEEVKLARRILERYKF